MSLKLYFCDILNGYVNEGTRWKLPEIAWRRHEIAVFTPVDFYHLESVKEDDKMMKARYNSYNFFCCCCQSKLLGKQTLYKKMNFCHFLGNAEIEDFFYLRNIFRTEESKFDLDSITNYHYAHSFCTNSE